MDGMSERRTLNAALQDYGVRRDTTARPMHRLTAELARLAPATPEMKALVSALAHDPAETRRFLAIMAGRFSATDFFAPANLERIMGTALAA